jgi:hypothetical protein
MNTEDKNNLSIGDYIMINNKHIGIIHKIIWNSNGYIVKLDNDDNYEDKTLKQYKLIEIDNLKGYMLVTLNDKINKIDINNITKIIDFLGPNGIGNIVNKINLKYNNFIQELNYKNNLSHNPEEYYYEKKK